MDYAMINKMEKAKRYAKERERFNFNQFSVTMTGGAGPHLVEYDNGKWQCDCDFFQGRGRCSHTMALETLLEGMVQIAYDEDQE